MVLTGVKEERVSLNYFEFSLLYKVCFVRK